MEVFNKNRKLDDTFTIFDGESFNSFHWFLKEIIQNKRKEEINSQSNMNKINIKDL